MLSCCTQSVRIVPNHPVFRKRTARAQHAGVPAGTRRDLQAKSSDARETADSDRKARAPRQFASEDSAAAGGGNQKHFSVRSQ